MTNKDATLEVLNWTVKYKIEYRNIILHLTEQSPKKPSGDGGLGKLIKSFGQKKSRLLGKTLFVLGFYKRNDVLTRYYSGKQSSQNKKS